MTNKRQKTNVIVTREFIPAPEKVREGYKILYECLAELIIKNQVKGSRADNLQTKEKI